MGKSNNYYFILVVIISILCGSYSCKKDIPSSDPGLFIRTYETNDTTAIAFFTEQMPDGGFFLVSAMGNSALLLSRTDPLGNLRWNKKIIAKGFSQYYLLSTPPWVFNTFITTGPNEFVAQSGGAMVRFDTTGKIQASTYNAYVNAALFQQGNNYFGSSCDGMLNGTKHSNNLVYVYDQNLKLKRTDTLQDARLGIGKVLQFFVDGIASDGAYNISGTKYITSNFTANANMKIFAANVSLTGGNLKQTIVDPDDSIHSDQMTWQTHTNDSGTIILGRRTDVTSTGSIVYPIAVKFDNNLNVLWEKEFKVNNSTVFPEQIKECSDGGFLIVGYIGKTGYGTNNLPYALKIDKNGHKQWDKTIFAFAGTGSFIYGTELNNGCYAFAGNTNSFGKGKPGNKVLFVKTDKDGNY